MTLKEIKKAVNEIADDAPTLRKEREIEDALSSLDELAEYLDALNEKLKDDTEYQEIMEIIENNAQIAVYGISIDQEGEKPKIRVPSEKRIISSKLAIIYLNSFSCFQSCDFVKNSFLIPSSFDFK